MSTQAIATVKRALPATLAHDAQEAGYRILSALDRLGFEHKTSDGRVFTICFCGVTVFGGQLAAFEIDTERMYHFSVADLSTPRVIAQLQSVTKKPVKVLRRKGFYYVIDLQPKPKTRLPDNVTLDLSAKPDGALVVPLGVGRDGAVWRNLPDVGHALIVGTSGAGKSTLIHSALAALLTSCGPDCLRVALIDPKRSEFAPWAGIPHLFGEDIANTEAQATDLLSELAAEIDRRGDLLAGALVRDLGAYNRKAANPLPYILCAIDECLDLVLSAGSKSNLAGYLKTIAIRGRSAGVILWAATQHASAVDGLPRVVNVNLSARLVFRVADSDAARVAGCPGAEAIPRDRPGRLLAKTDGKPVVLQGYHLPDADLLRVARAIAGSKPSGPTLTETERDLLTWAATDNGGALTLADIRARANVGPNEAKRIAGSFERRGWIEKDKSGKNRRVLTEQGSAAGQKAVKLSNSEDSEN